MNLAQAPNAVAPLRVEGVVELLSPLLIQDHYQALVASATVAYLVGGDDDGAGFELLNKSQKSFDRLVDLLRNTLDLKGGAGYDYGVFPLHSSVRAITILSKSDSHKSYLLDKGAVPLLIRTLEQFVNDTGGGIAGGGGKDVESAALAIEGLRTFSNAPPSVTDKSAYLPNMFPDYNKIAASLKAFKEKESVISFTSSFDSNAIRDAQSLMDALEYNNKAKSTLILANELKNTGQRRKSAVGIASSKQIQDAEAAKEKEQYEETERIVKEQKNLLERRIADSEKEKAEIAKKLKIAEDAAKSADNDKDRKIRDLEQALTAKLEKKADAEKDAMQQQFEELKLLMLSLHKKTDTIQEGVTEIATTTNQLLSTFQNFLTSDFFSPVLRLILIGPPATSKEEITGKMDLEADIDKAHSMLSSPLTFAKSFMLTKTTAVVHVLCAYDISTCVSFEIKEPKEFIKKHAPAIKISLKVMKLAAFGTKLVTGIALPFTTPDTSTVDSFLDSASGMCDAAFRWCWTLGK